MEDRVDEDTTATRFDLAAALAADFKPLGVPLALMGEYLFTVGRQTEVALGRTNPHTHSVALGLYYTGRPDLAAWPRGVVLDSAPHIGRGVRGRFATSGRPRLTYGQLILRYLVRREGRQTSSAERGLPSWVDSAEREGVCRLRSRSSPCAHSRGSCSLSCSWC